MSGEIFCGRGTPSLGAFKFFLNCRGLGNPDAVRALQKLIFSKRPMVVFLMETRKKSFEVQRMRRSLILPHCYSVDCSGEGKRRAGGLTLLWHRDVEVDIISSSMHHISFWVQTPDLNDRVLLTGVYGYAQQVNKVHTLSLLRALAPTNDVAWLCFGDFNYILRPEDKIGGDNPNHAEMLAFHEVMSEFSLHDLGFEGYQFTWSNKRPIPNSIEERLDFFLANDKWFSLWQSTWVTHLMPHASDHSPIIAESCVTRRKKKKRRVHQFRFEELWLQEEAECEEIIQNSWNHTGSDITTKLTGTASVLDEWGRSKFGALSKQIADTRECLKKAIAEPKTVSNIQRISDLETELDKLLANDEIKWKQRSRASWLQYGDRNNNFFHRKASQRQSRNHISKIYDDQGHKFEEEEDIANVLRVYFQQLFASSHPTGIADITTLVSNRVSPGNLAILESPFTSDEVEAALSHMHPTKAPGVDGMPTLFYKRF